MHIYRVIYQGREFTNRGASRKDALHTYGLLAQTQDTSKIRIEVFDSKSGDWKQYLPPARRNKSGGRVTYTVACVDPYMQRSTSRLGRQVSKREAMKVASMWERNGAANVCVIDSNGRIHYQPSNHPVNRNRSGQSKRVQFFGYDVNKENSEVKRAYIDTSQRGDTGADPIGDGTFRMYPSGDIVSWDERNRRLGSPSLNKNKGFRL